MPGQIPNPLYLAVQRNAKAYPYRATIRRGGPGAPASAASDVVLGEYGAARGIDAASNAPDAVPVVLAVGVPCRLVRFGGTIPSTGTASAANAVVGAYRVCFAVDTFPTAPTDDGHAVDAFGPAIGDLLDITPEPDDIGDDAYESMLPVALCMLGDVKGGSAPPGVERVVVCLPSDVTPAQADASILASLGFSLGAVPPVVSAMPGRSA